MSRIWYCPTCGYEVTSRGRCHSCGERLVASELPELAADGGDEVGYRLDEWTDRDRGRLIEALNDGAILHRFEDDELVVAAEDEATVDDLVTEVTTGAYDDEDEGESAGAGADWDDAGDASSADPALDSALRLLADAAERLQRDPTDMQADGDVAEASTAVFFADTYPGLSEDSWAAVGRVTRRLLSVLGSEEALEDEIRSEATVLAQLLKPVVAGTESPSRLEDTDEGEQTVYELPDWLPEQRAQLGILLERADIDYEWDQDDLVVPAVNEEEVERLFAEVGGAADDDDADGGEERYHALEELFAASGRLASDPTDEERAAAVVMWVHEVLGPPPLGMDEVYWLRITSRARALAEVLENDVDADADVIHDEASALHGLLRTVV